MSPKSVLPVGLAIAFLASLAATALGQPATYGQARNPVNCGIVLVPSTGSTQSPGGTNADPYVFYNMLKRQDLLPGGWDFVNPYAPTIVDQRIYDRWTAIMGGVAPYSLGDKIQRSTAPYWEVYLDDLTDRQLANYNILLIHAPGGLRFTADQRERLRRFVDAGGILWFDKATSQAVDANSGFPLAFTVSAAGGNAQVVDPAHPLLNYPHKLSLSEASTLGGHHGGHAILQPDVADPRRTDISRFEKVVVNSAGGVILDADFGTGHFVATSCNVVSNINEPAGGTSTPLGRNSGPFAGTSFLNIPTADLKFAYNLMGLAGGHPSHSKGSRKLNATFEDLGAPLLDKWHTIVTPQNSFNQHGRLYRTPVLFKGLLIITSGTEIFAYDIDPARDLDNDGNPDDGYPDFSKGAPNDLVWQAQLGAPLSTPLAVEVADADQGVPLNQIWVMDANSTVHLVNAFTMDDYRLAWHPDHLVILPPRSPMLVPSGITPNALTYSDGMIFASGGREVPPTNVQTGVCWVISPRCARLVASSAEIFFVAEGSAQSAVTRPFDTTPTVGYVPQASEGGGSDQMVYVGYQHELGGRRGGPGVAALWFRSRGEKLRVQTYDPASGMSKVRSRASTANLQVYWASSGSAFEELSPRFFAYRQNTGEPVTLANNWQPGAVPGEFLYQGDLRAYDIYADYTIDWSYTVGTTPNLARIARTTLELPDESNPKHEITKSMALAPNGNLFVITSNVDVDSGGGPKSGGGSIYCFKERLNASELVYRWQLHHGYSQTLSGGSLQEVPPVFADHDDLLLLPVPGFGQIGDILGTELIKMHFHGGPTIHNNMLYVPVSARKSIGGFGEVYVTLLLALDADPPPPEVRLGGPIVGGAGSVEISQPDPTISLSKDNPTGIWHLRYRAGRNNLEVDAEAGIIRVNNFMTSLKGSVRDAISVSQPVAVRVGTQGQVMIDPNATGNRWSPLRWFMVFNGFTNESPVMVTGNTLFLVGGWMLDSLVCGPMQIPPVQRSIVIGMDADIPTSDEFLRNDPLVPNNTHSNRQLMFAKQNPDGTFKWNPHIRWPSTEGLQTLDDYCVRVRQCLLGNGRMALGAIGGDGVLAVWADDGTYVFERALTLIADQNRVLAVDNSGFVDWTSENTYAGTFADTALFLRVAQLTAPTKVYELGPSDYLVVDTGADRIVRIDRAGFERRLIEGFNVDEKLVKDRVLVGYTPGDSTSLKQPRDVKTWSDYVSIQDNPFTVRSSTGLEYWDHYLIADTGNGRLVEVVDRFVADPETYVVGGLVGPDTVLQLVYYSPLNAVGRSYRYQSVDRALTGLDQNGHATFAYVAAVGNWETSETAVGVGPPLGGGTAELQAYSGAGALVVEYFDEELSPAERLRVIHKVAAPTSPTGERALVNPVSAQVVTRGWDEAMGRALISVLVADQAGVVEVAPDANGVWTVIWELTNENYSVVRGVPLLASGARKLTNGNVLVTNAFLGRTFVGALFSGEVVEFRAADYNPSRKNNGYTMASVRAEIPPVVGARSLRTPLFADRR
jgi:hypothetical protein